MFLYMIIVRQEYYCKRHKLNEKKILRFNPNVGKTFAGLALSVLKVLKKAIAQKIHQESFHILSKICKNRKTFLSLNLYTGG